MKRNRKRVLAYLIALSLVIIASQGKLIAKSNEPLDDFYNEYYEDADEKEKQKTLELNRNKRYRHPK